MLDPRIKAKRDVALARRQRLIDDINRAPVRPVELLEELERLEEALSLLLFEIRRGVHGTEKSPGRLEDYRG